MEGKITETDKVLLAMLRERVGHSIFDSGDFYGRHYERNQRTDLLKERPWYRFEQYSDGDKQLIVDIPLFLYLRQHLKYDDEMTKELDAFIDDYFDYDYAEKFVEHLIEKTGEPWRIAFSDNSYNDEDFSVLTQGFQYYVLESCIKRDSMYSQCKVRVILEVHGGCDTRGGYTWPKVFIPDDEVLYSPRPALTCKACDWYWAIESGFARWDKEHPFLPEAYGNREIIIDPAEVELLFTDKSPKEALKLAKELAGPANNALVVDDEGQGYCPRCGRPLFVYGCNECSEWHTDEEIEFDASPIVKEVA